MKTNTNRTNWNQVIPEWQASGLTVSSFCKNNGINTGAMYCALRRRNISSQNHITQLQENATTFIPLAIVQENRDRENRSPLTITIGKASIQVDSETDLSLFEDTVRILSRVC